MQNIAWDLWAERGGLTLTGRDSMPDDELEAADGGRVRSVKLSGRDWYIAHINDSVATPSDDDSRDGSQHTGHDSSRGGSLRGRDLWLRRLYERQP